MLEHSVDLDHVFHALADPTRRAIVTRLDAGPASVSALAERLPMTLAAVVQHVQVLERSRLVRTRKIGRTRHCELDPAVLEQAERWLAGRRTFWTDQFGHLDAALGAQDAKTGAREEKET